MFRRWLKRQYERTMREAYAFARASAASGAAGNVLDCGSGSGHERNATFGAVGPDALAYVGLEWSGEDVRSGQSHALDIRQADLNQPLPIESDSQDRIIAFSVLEHLLMPCSFLLECRRVLRPGGRLVILTPNISTYFTVLQVLLGRMPSSGPHPDSNWLLDAGQAAPLSGVVRDDMSSDTPQHRHLVVFSYRVLDRFLSSSGFRIEASRGFGYYPLPGMIQPFFERLDAAHCHQMVFVCTKEG